MTLSTAQFQTQLINLTDLTVENIISTDESVKKKITDSISENVTDSVLESK